VSISSTPQTRRIGTPQPLQIAFTSSRLQAGLTVFGGWHPVASSCPARGLPRAYAAEFSSSSCFSRRMSGGSIRHTSKVRRLIPALRQMSATGTPSARCFKMNAFWAFENSLPSWSFAPPSLGDHSEKLQFKAVQLPGARSTELVPLFPSKQGQDENSNVKQVNALRLYRSSYFALNCAANSGPSSKLPSV